MKIMMIAGENDSLMDPRDLQLLLNYLPDSTKMIFIDDYNHVDYMWASDANEKVNDVVRKYLRSHML